jgi:hypothetical protein
MHLWASAVGARNREVLKRGRRERRVPRLFVKFVIPTGGRNLFLRGEKRYYVYIMSSKGRVLYTGVTGFLMARVLQHKAGQVARVYAALPGSVVSAHGVFVARANPLLKFQHYDFGIRAQAKRWSPRAGAA